MRIRKGTAAKFKELQVGKLRLAYKRIRELEAEIAVLSKQMKEQSKEQGDASSGEKKERYKALESGREIDG